MNETLYHEAEQVGGYNALALRAMALWAHEHRSDKEAMRIASFVWQRNARIMAKAVERFPKDFEQDGHSTDDYLSLFAMAQLSRADAAILALERIDKTLAAWQVRERVDTLKKRTTRQRAKPKDDAPILSAYEKFKHLDSVFRFAQGQPDDDPFHTTAAELWSVIREYALATRQRAKPDTLAERCADLVNKWHSVSIGYTNPEIDNQIIDDYSRCADELADIPEIASALAARNGGEKAER